MLMCAIPGCKASEKLLRSGQLHLVDVFESKGETGVPFTRKKFVWLCSSCVQTHTVQGWRAPGQQIRLRSVEKGSDLPDLIDGGSSRSPNSLGKHNISL